MKFDYETNAERSYNYLDREDVLKEEYDKLKGNPIEEFDEDGGYIERLIS
jgi:hypothetical protein